MFRTIFIKRGAIIAVRQRSANSITSRRNYANWKNPTAEGHAEPQKPGGDLPWIIGSLAFTIPAVAYLLSLPSAGSHSTHEEAHSVLAHSSADAHPVEKNEEQLPSSPAELKEKVKQAANETAGSAKAEYEAFKSSAHNRLEGVREVAKSTYEDTKEKVDYLVEVVKESSSDSFDSAGQTATEAIESLKQTTSDVAGSAEDSAQTSNYSKGKDISRTQTTPLDPSKSDSTDTSKDPKSMSELSGKQEGIPNALTFHSTLGREKGEMISKKPEGAPDSSRLKETVDPKRGEKKLRNE